MSQSMKINGYILADIIMISAMFFLFGYLFCLWMSSKNFRPWE
jgi:hypothetical protein